MSKRKSLILGIALGSTVGAGVVLLSSPSSGKYMRKRLKETIYSWKDFADVLKENGFEFKNKITKTSQEGALLFKELTQEMKGSVENWKETVEPHQKNINQYLEQIEVNLKELEDKVKNK